MFLWLKTLSGSLSNGMWFSGKPEISRMDLDADWAEIAPLIQDEGLPHGQADLAAWLQQPGARGLVARKDGRFAGFVIAHPFGKVAHLDLLCIHPDFRKASIARPLYYTMVNGLKTDGFRGFVAHARPDAGQILEQVGWRRTTGFTLVERNVGEVTVSGGHRGELVEGTEMGVDEIATLDAETFGAARPEWLQEMFYRGPNEFYGFRNKGQLTACLALAHTANDGLKILLATGREFKDISSLLHVVLVMNSGRNVECLVRDDAKLSVMLESLDFETPAGHIPYGEYRLGDTAGVGDGAGVLNLSWW